MAFDARKEIRGKHIDAECQAMVRCLMLTLTFFLIAGVVYISLLLAFEAFTYPSNLIEVRPLFFVADAIAIVPSLLAFISYVKARQRYVSWCRRNDEQIPAAESRAIRIRYIEFVACWPIEMFVFHYLFPFIIQAI